MTSRSPILGAGANGDNEACLDKNTAVNVAKECLLAAAKADPKAAHVWTNLANAYYMAGDHRHSGKCLEKVIIVFFSYQFVINDTPIQF